VLFFYGGGLRFCHNMPVIAYIFVGFWVVLGLFFLKRDVFRQNKHTPPPPVGGYFLCRAYSNMFLFIKPPRKGGALGVR
jgi:hypothetical protein